MFRKLELSKEAVALSESLDFDLQGYGMAAHEEQTRPPRTVRIGAIQNSIVLPTDAPILKQVKIFFL